MDDISYLQILRLRAAGDLEGLNEASLGRAYQHTQKTGHSSFGIVTAHRSDASPKENKANMKALKSDLKSMGYGHTRMKGHWGGQSEPSLFVPGMSKAHAEHIRSKYNQDAVIHKGPESDHKVSLITREGDNVDLGKFHPHKIAQAYSSVKGAPFTFEWAAGSYGEAIIERLFEIGRMS